MTTTTTRKDLGLGVKLTILVAAVIAVVYGALAMLGK